MGVHPHSICLPPWGGRQMLKFYLRTLSILSRKCLDVELCLGSYMTQFFLISVSRTERMSPFESLWLASISMIYIYMYAIIWPMSFDHGGHSPWSYEFGQVPGACFLTFICSQFVPYACAPSCNSMLLAMTLWKANSVLRFQATNSNNNYQHPPTWLLTFRLLLRKWIVLAILPWSGPWSTAAWWREFGVLQADYVKYVIWHSNPTKVFCGKML